MLVGKRRVAAFGPGNGGPAAPCLMMLSFLFSFNRPGLLVQTDAAIMPDSVVPCLVLVVSAMYMFLIKIGNPPL